MERLQSHAPQKWDLYLPFLERAYQLLRLNGHMVFIISDAYNAAKYAPKSHEFFLNNACVERIDFLTEIPLFEAGINNTIVHFAKVTPGTSHHPVRVRRWGEQPEDFEQNAEVLPTARQAEYGAMLFKANEAPAGQKVVGSVELGRVCYVSVGMVIHCDEKKAQGLFKAEDLVSEIQDKKHPKSYVEGKDIVRWGVQRVRYLEYGTKRAPAMFRRPTFPYLHEAKERLLALRMCGETPAVTYDNRQLLSNHTAIIFVPWHYLKAVRNTSIKKTAKYQDEVKRNEIPRDVFREELEKLSLQFTPKYMLAIMNSTFARNFLNKHRRSKLDIYPNDWKQHALQRRARR